MIRPAYKEEARILTELSFASKGYWNYPASYFEIWKDELTIGAGYIEKNDVYVCIRETTIAGYYALVELENDVVISGITINRGHWLEHMFVRPKYIGGGIGTELFGHLRKRCEGLSIKRLGILADPNSKGFYEKMGCRYRREIPSTIQNRTTPFLTLDI